jgi:preprotein translocase subunit SecF
MCGAVVASTRFRSRGGGVPFEIIKPGTHFDFISRWKVCAALSLTVLLLAALAVPIRGVRLGVDFAGGTEMLVRFADDSPVTESEIREVLAEQGVPDAVVVRFRDLGAAEFSVRFAGEPGEKGEHVDHLKEALASRFGELHVDRVEFVGPRVGAELRRDGVNALLLAALLILGYVAFRFSARFAPGAVVALVHDVAVTAGIFVMLGLEFDLRVLAALLAILGYSLNDTIIVYDRIRENMEVRTKADLPEVLNLSVNQTLSRTILTSGTTMLAVLSLLILGGEVLRPFALAMAIGIVVGTYSSIYIAAPVLLFLEQRFGDTGHARTAAPKAKAKAASGAKRKRNRA